MGGEKTWRNRIICARASCWRNPGIPVDAGAGVETSKKMHGSRIALPLGAAFACVIAALTLVPARNRGRNAAGGAGRSGASCRPRARPLVQCRRRPPRDRGRARGQGRRPRAELPRPRARPQGDGRSGAGGAGRGRQLGAGGGGARCRQLRARLHRRRAAGFRRPCRHRARRPVRVRRHPRCGARRIAHGVRRAGRRAGARPCRRRHRAHRRHLCFARRRHAGADRAFRAQGGAQDRPHDRADGRLSGPHAAGGRGLDGAAPRRQQGQRHASPRPPRARCARR